MFFESEIPTKIDNGIDDGISKNIYIEKPLINIKENDVDSQITEDVCIREPSTSFENCDTNIVQPASGIFYIFVFLNKLTFVNISRIQMLSVITDADKQVKIKLEPISPYVQLPLSPPSSQSECYRPDSQVETSSNVSICNFKVWL